MTALAEPRKRIKSVFPGDEIAHLWANHHPTTARNPQGNISMAGSVLKSYAEPIGRLIQAKGQTVALFLDKSWSITTSKHQSWMRQAAHRYPHFTVPAIGTSRGWTDAKIDHTANLKSYASKIAEAALAAKRCREATRDWKIGHLAGVIEEANNYAETFKLKTRFTAPTDEKIADMLAGEREAAKRVRLARIENERLAKLAAADALAEWLAGSAKYYPALRSLDSAYMRLEGEEVVTTHGARVPADHVKRALPLILRLIARGETWHTNGHTIHVGHYQLKEVTAAGEVVAGCHRFAAEEVKRFAAVLGVSTDVIGKAFSV